MNGKILMEALGGINDEFISEAFDTDNMKELFAEWNDDEEREQKPTKKRIGKPLRILIAAAITASIILAANIAATAGGYKSSLDLLKEFGDRIIDMIEGQKTEYKGITIIKKGTYYESSSVDKFFKETDFDILYPSKLPEDKKIRLISVSGSIDAHGEYSSEYRVITYCTNDFNTTISADTHPDGPKIYNIGYDYEKIIIGEFECYYFYTIDSTVQAKFLYNNIVYSVFAPTYEDMVTIVSGMKEYKE